MVPTRTTEHTTPSCPVCDGSPRVLITIRHDGMRHLTEQLLSRDHHCWVPDASRDGEPLAASIRRVEPDLLIIDAGDFPACCRAALDEFPAGRVIVIGPEPDDAYRLAALHHGAGGWIPRDRVGEELGPAMRQVLGCRHHPCPTDGGA